MRGKSPGDEVGDTYEQVLERGGGGRESDPEFPLLL